MERGLRIDIRVRQTLIIIISIALWTSFTSVDRSNFSLLIIHFSALFFLFFLAIKVDLTWKQVLVIGVLFRLTLFFMTPNLSQDFYRFIWDGSLMNYGLNPYAYTPNRLMHTTSNVIFENQNVLFNKMGSLSASNYSNYPPFNQYLFGLASWLGGGSTYGAMLLMRIQVLLADVGIFLVASKLLKFFGKPDKLAYLYFLNPFVIAELTGNLHYEGVMMFFLITSIYFLCKNQLSYAAIFWALSINTKLLPLMLLPVFIRVFNLKKLVKFYVLIGLTCVLLLIPFISLFSFENYFYTISLWFNKFEFNASIYYLLRWVGFHVSGYNQIVLMGKILSVLIFTLITYISLRKSTATLTGLIKKSYIILICYFLLSTTVHPWYIVSPLLLSIFLKSRIALLWSFLVLLSYSAYQFPEVKENSILLIVEYGLLFLFILYEVYKHKRQENQS